MRVSFDSNVWEPIFDPGDRRFVPIRAALTNRRVEGFICDAGFRIEAIRNRDRADYFQLIHSASRDNQPRILTKEMKADADPHTRMT